MAGQVGGMVLGGAKTWVASVAVAVALGGVQLATSWGTYSAHVVFNAVGVASKVITHSGDWVQEGRNGGAAADPKGGATSTAPTGTQPAATTGK